MVRQCDERAESTFIGMSFRKGKGPGNEVEDELKCNKSCLN